MNHPFPPIEENLEDEMTYKCLVCEACFIKFQSNELECPECGTGDEQFLQPATGLEEDEYDQSFPSVIA